MRGVDVIRMFGIESILIWTALMMKKRIVVYSESIGVLLKVIRYAHMRATAGWMTGTGGSG